MTQFAFSPRMVAVLKDIRTKMAFNESRYITGEPIQETYDGPAGTIPGSHGDSAGGIGAAMNISDAQDNLDSYIYGIASTLAQTAGLEDDEAFDLVADALDSLASEGSIVEVPGDDADIAAVGQWLGYAKTIGLDAMVLDFIADGAAS